MNNDTPLERINTLLKSLKAQAEAHVGLIDMTPDLDACVDELLARQLIRLSIQANTRLLELGIDETVIPLRAAVSRLECDHLFSSKRLPSLDALRKIAGSLHCNLLLTFTPAYPGGTATGALDQLIEYDRIVEQHKVSCELSTDQSETECLQSLSHSMEALELVVETGFCKAILKPKNRVQNLDDFFSTRSVLRSALSRLYTVKLSFVPTEEWMLSTATIF